LAKDNVIGLFYGHDHSNTVSAETKITYDGTQYTLTQGFGGGIDVYDGDYDGIDPQGSCYVIDKDGDLIKEAFSYTGLLTDDVTYPSGDEGVKYIKKVALFNGTSFAAACDEARKAGYIPITRAFSDGYNDADLNSNGRGTRKFTGSGDQYQCIAYQQTTNPDEAITDLRMFVTTDETYSINNQTKTYTLNEKESEYRIVSGCGGNVNYGVTSNTSCAFLYYTTNRNAGAPLTELVVESEESSSTDAYRTMDHRCLQIGNFVETFGTNAVSSFSKARIANLNWGASRDTVIGDSVYLFMKRYDGVSGYNTKYSYEAVTGVPETVFAPASSFRAYINRSLDSTGVATMDSTSSTTGKLYFYCPDATAVTVTAMSGTGSNAAVLSSCTAGNNGRMTKQSDGLFYAKITDGTVSGLNADSSGVIKWVFTYSIAGSSAVKTQIAYSTVVASAASNAVTADKTALRSFIGNLNQSTFVKDAENTFSCDNGFLTALANASYVLGNPAATQAEVDAEKEALLTAAEQTSMLYVPDTPDENVETLLESCGGYIYGVCQPNENYETLQDTGFNWVRFDIPCPFDKNGYNGGNIKYVRNEYKKFKERCQAYHDNGFKILAVTPYPKDLISDMSIQDPTGDFESFMDIAVDVATFLYNDLKDDGKGGRCVDMFQITNEMGLATFTLPLSLEQAATYVGEQLKVIDAEKKKTNDDFPIGYNSADLLQSSMDLHELLKPYLPYCDYVALDLYTGNQGEATAKDYSKTVRKLYSITQKPVIMTEFGFWSDGGLKSAAQKSAILYENYGYNSEAEAIADGQNFIDKLPAQFRKTLNQDYPDQEDKWPSLVFGKYANHFYGETSPYTINDIPHTPEGQGEYFREVMTELKKVGCLAGMIIYGCQDKDVCFNCGHSWCPYETKFGLFNYDGTPKPALTAIKETIASLSAQDGAAQGTATASDFDGTKTTVTVCHKSGSKTLLRAVGEVYKSSTVFTSTTSIPGYTCEYDSAVYANVSSALSESYQAYTPISYTATENANGETAVPFAIEGNDLVLVTPQRAGYRFVGWKATSVAGSALNQTDFIKNKVYAAGTYKGMYGNVGFDAQWQGNEYTVTFDVSNGGSVSTPSKKVVFGNPYGTLPEATAPDGKIFGGWFTAKTGGTLVTADSIYQTA
ncbi:MAG TPA: hypothetical protein DDY98_04170, partial [Ruminococcaceae bacterium]|nr:hypothetical protein [Oscillospiraceae bacterium]